MDGIRTQFVDGIRTEFAHGIRTNFVYEKRSLGIPKRAPRRPKWIALGHAQKPQNVCPRKAPTRINLGDKVLACVRLVYTYICM